MIVKVYYSVKFIEATMSQPMVSFVGLPYTLNHSLTKKHKIRISLLSLTCAVILQRSYNDKAMTKETN